MSEALDRIDTIPVPNEKRGGIEYYGLSTREIELIDTILKRTGLPLTNIKKVEYKHKEKEEKPGKWDLNRSDDGWGTGASYNHMTQILNLRSNAFKNYDQLVTTTLHEVAHSCSPFTALIMGIKSLDEKLDLFTDKKTKPVVDFALSCLAGNTKYINDYHKKTAGDGTLKPITSEDFNNLLEVDSATALKYLIYFEETWAIYVENRFMYPLTLAENTGSTKLQAPLDKHIEALLKTKNKKATLKAQALSYQSLASEYLGVKTAA